MATDFGNPLAGGPAYSSTNTSFPDRDEVALDFGTQFAGQTVRLRFRLGTDVSCCTGGTGWDIDDISVSGIDNTPFPVIVAEDSTCSATPVLLPPSGVSDVGATREASMDGLPDLDSPRRSEEQLHPAQSAARTNS